MRVESASGRTRRADKGAAMAANHTLQTIDPPWLPSRVQPALFEVPFGHPALKVPRLARGWLGSNSQKWAKS
jgi:hypothetical protein